METASPRRVPTKYKTTPKYECRVPGEGGGSRYSSRGAALDCAAYLLAEGKDVEIRRIRPDGSA